MTRVMTDESGGGDSYAILTVRHGTLYAVALLASWLRAMHLWHPGCSILLIFSSITPAPIYGTYVLTISREGPSHLILTTVTPAVPYCTGSPQSSLAHHACCCWGAAGLLGSAIRTVHKGKPCTSTRTLPYLHVSIELKRTNT